MIPLLFCAIFSLGFVAWVWLVARGRHGVASSLAVSGPLTLVFGMFSLLLAVQAFFTFLATWVCVVCGLKARAVLVSSLLVMVVVYGLVIRGGWERQHRLAELKENYPMQSLSDRLAYETPRPMDATPTSSNIHAVSLPVQVEQRLENFERREEQTGRSFSLERLHVFTRDEFAMAAGFGSMRMATSLSPRMIELPEPDPVPLPSYPEVDPNYQPFQESNPPLANHVQNLDNLSRVKLLSLHDGSAEDFLEPGRMGYVKDREHVAGFQSHQFQAMPWIKGETSEWQVVRLELVSLLKHETPVVYLSKNLPRMEELKSTKTRPLSEFERQALERLTSQEDLISEEGVNVIRMVGSLGAGTDCLACHSVRRGELLGAFSYELRRVKPLPEPPKRNPDRQAAMLSEFEFSRFAFLRQSD